MRQVFFILFFAGLFCTIRIHAQQKDSLAAKPISDSALEKQDSIYSGKKSPSNKDSLQEAQRKHYRKATLYSTFLPGAGQVYNKKYWKVPIVYAAIGIPAYFYFYNKDYYNQAQYALTVTINQSGSIVWRKFPLISCPWLRAEIQMPLLLSGMKHAKTRIILFCFFFYFMD